MCMIYSRMLPTVFSSSVVKALLCPLWPWLPKAAPEQSRLTDVTLSVLLSGIVDHLSPTVKSSAFIQTFLFFLLIEKPPTPFMRVVESDRRTNRRKPPWRVPITAPPTTSTTTTTTTTTTAKKIHVVTTRTRRKWAATMATTTAATSTAKATPQEKMVSAAPVYKQQDLGRPHCPRTRARGITWPPTPAGTVASAPCPNNLSSLGTWACQEDTKRWAPGGADLSTCRSSWVSNLQLPPSRTAEELDQQLAMYPLFGGDVLGVLDAAEAAIRRMRPRGVGHGGLFVMEMAGKLARSLSSLLLPRAKPAWKDLPLTTRAAAAQRLLKAAEDLGGAIPALLRLPDGATIATENVCE